MKKTKILLLVLLMSLLVACGNNKGKDTTKEETKKEEQTTKETQLETKVETKNETKAEEKKKSSNTVDVKVEDKENEKDADVIESVDTTKNKADKLQNEMTKNMLEKLNDYAVSLVTLGGNTVNKFPKENLQAIAKYEDSESFGWVIRYGVNKIGLGKYYKISKTKVLVLFDGRGILESKEDVIKNDSPEEYKRVAEQILKKELKNDAKIDYAY